MSGATSNAHPHPVEQVDYDKKRGAVCLFADDGRRKNQLDGNGWTAHATGVNRYTDYLIASKSFLHSHQQSNITLR